MTKLFKTALNLDSCIYPARPRFFLFVHTITGLGVIYHISFLIHSITMAESKPLTRLIRASRELTMDAVISVAAFAVPGIIIATPRLDSELWFFHLHDIVG